LILLVSGCTIKVQSNECLWYRPLINSLTEEDIDTISNEAIIDIKYNENQYITNCE